MYKFYINKICLTEFKNILLLLYSVFMAQSGWRGFFFWGLGRMGEFSASKMRWFELTRGWHWQKECVYYIKGLIMLMFLKIHAHNHPYYINILSCASTYYNKRHSSKTHTQTHININFCYTQLCQEKYYKITTNIL